MSFALKLVTASHLTANVAIARNTSDCHYQAVITHLCLLLVIALTELLNWAHKFHVFTENK